MNTALQELAARKQLLVARSTLHRLGVQHSAIALRGSLLAPRNALGFLAAPAVRPLLFSALLAILGGSRLGRVLRGAMAGLAIARTVYAIVRDRR